MKYENSGQQEKKQHLDGVKGLSFKFKCVVFQLFSIPPYSEKDNEHKIV